MAGTIAGKTIPEDDLVPVAVFVDLYENATYNVTANMFYGEGARRVVALTRRIRAGAQGWRRGPSSPCSTSGSTPSLDQGSGWVRLAGVHEAGVRWGGLTGRRQPPNDLRTMYKSTYAVGARMLSNSWGQRLNFR